MNHWERVAEYKGKVVAVYDDRLVRIKSPSVPGQAFCEAVDGLGGIAEVCTAFLTPQALERAQELLPEPSCDGCGDRIDCCMCDDGWNQARQRELIGNTPTCEDCGAPQDHCTCEEN